MRAYTGGYGRFSRSRVFILLAVSLIVAGCGRKQAPESSSEEPAAAPVSVAVATSTVQPMAVTLTAQGTLTPAQGASARIAAVAAGKLVAIRVREGDQVVAGQLIALVDSQLQQAQSRGAAAALASSEALARQSELTALAAAADRQSAIRSARLALAAANSDYANAVKLAQNALQAAETDLHKVQAGARPQEIAQAEQAIAQAKATQSRAATELTRVQFLFEKGIAAKRQVEDARTALAVADAALESARQQASLLRAGSRPEEIRAAELRVQQAHADVAQAKVSGNAKIQQAKVALQQAEQSALQVAAKRQDTQASRDTVSQKRADLNAAQVTTHYTMVRAPLSGIVTHRALNPGDMADPSTPIVEIANTSNLNLLANLPAENGIQVRPGMPAHVTTTETPGKTFDGRVLSVGQVDPQTNLLAVRIAVANPEALLRIGVFATAVIIRRVNPRAIVVPKEAVFTRGENSVLFVVGAGNVAHQRVVNTGAEQNGLIEIVKGIKAGERVIRVGQYELSDGAKITPTAQAPEAKGAAR